MLNLTSAALKVFLALEACDMRKSFTDTNPGSATRLFYRISASPTN